MPYSHVLATTASALILAGCTLGGGYGDSAAIPTGSALVLHERLPLATDSTRVYIHGGEVVSQGKVNRFRVACFIRLQRRGDERLADAIEPGRFLAIEGSRSWARTRPGDDSVGLTDNPQRLDYFTEVEIRSDLQPQVDELQCRFNGYRTADAPGLGRIRETLGELIAITLPDGKCGHAGWKGHPPVFARSDEAESAVLAAN